MSEEGTRLIYLRATATADRGARIAGMPGDLWMLPMSLVLLGGFVAIVLAFNGSHAGAVIAFAAIAGGGFGGCMWAFAGRPPKWFWNRLQTLWWGPHFEVRRRRQSKQHPFA